MIAGLTAMTNGAAAAERKLLMAGFKDIVIENDIAVELTIGKSPKAVVSGDKRDLPRVVLQRRGDVLIVQLRSRAADARTRPMTQPLVLKLQNYDLENVTIRGNGRLDTTSLSNSNRARILIQGSGLLNIGTLKADQLVATIVGNGQAKVASGDVRDGLIEIQGGAIVDTGDLLFRDLAVTHQGNGETRATVKNAARITNNGRGRISISGSANCFVKQAGSATIDCPKYGK